MSQDTEIYPDVSIWSGEPIKWIVPIIINLDEEKVVYVDEYPARYGPTLPGETD